MTTSFWNSLITKWRANRQPRTPSILQMEAVECGAVSLAMVLAHYEVWVALEQLRIACGVTRDGTKASSLLRAARHYGLNARGYRKEPEGLEALTLPAILHWNFNHFVVLTALSPTSAWINDPARGPIRITREELDQAFTGVVLTFEPTDNLPQTAPPQGLLTALKERAKSSKKSLIFLFVMSLLLLIPSMATPVFTKIFVDGILTKRQTNWIEPLFIGMISMALLNAYMVWLRSSVMQRLTQKISQIGSSTFVWHILHLPVNFFTQRSHGEVAQRIEANQQVANAISDDLIQAMAGLCSMVLFGCILIGYDPLLGSLTVAIAAPVVWLAKWTQTQLEDASRSLAVQHGKLGGMTAATIYGIESIKANGLEKRVFERWAGTHANSLSATRDLMQRSLLLSQLPTLLMGLTDLMILGLGAWRVMLGVFTIGDLLAFQVLAASFLGPLQGLIGLGPRMSGIKANLHRINDALRNPCDPLTMVEPMHSPDSVTAAPASDLPRLAGHLAISDLMFGYSPLDAPLVHGFSLRINPGERVALVGRSGCGKSTLGRVICGLVAPWEGRVQLDGQDLHAMPSYARACNVAYVDQDIFLFEGTVRENLSLWNPLVDDATLKQALADAEMLDDVMARPGELDAHIEEGGRNFSGGQRQRLEIARALVTSPALLILDEATAALDPQIEKRIDENLRRCGCTLLIIAHRLSTVRDCNEILVMEKGQVIERGNHSQLMAMQGAYASLVQSDGQA